jgi:cytochrome bd-type quinol oxidase subunit 2
MFQINLFGKGGIDPTTINAITFYDILLRSVRVALALIGVLAVIYIIVAGIQYITAAGAEAKQAEAKKTIQYAIIGIIVAMLAFVITNELLRRLNFNATIREEINNQVEQSNTSDPTRQDIIR